MTPLFLMEDLKAELEPLLSRVGLLCGGTYKVYLQNLPPRKVQGDYSCFPYCRIEAGEGRDDEDSTQDVILVFGVRDESPDYQGYRDVMNGIQVVRERLLKNPVIGGRFELLRPIEWVIPGDTESYPAYFGAMLLRFRLPDMERISEFA